MGIRGGFWIGGIALVATLGGIAAYSAIDPGMLSSLRGTDRAAFPSSPPGVEPVRRASRIDGDMRATFERLEKSGEKSGGQAAPAPHATAADTPPAAQPQRLPAPTAAPERAPSPAADLARPARGMPVSLVPQRAASVDAPRGADAPRVMDPRMTKALDLLAGSSTMPSVATLPDAAVGVGADAAPAVLRPPAIVPQLAEKNESEMTADDLNAREHQRIRRTLEESAGGTN